MLGVARARSMQPQRRRGLAPHRARDAGSPDVDSRAPGPTLAVEYAFSGGQDARIPRPVARVLRASYACSCSSSSALAGLLPIHRVPHRPFRRGPAARRAAVVPSLDVHARPHPAARDDRQGAWYGVPNVGFSSRLHGAHNEMSRRRAGPGPDGVADARPTSRAIVAAGLPVCQGWDRTRAPPHPRRWLLVPTGLDLQAERTAAKAPSSGQPTTVSA